MPTKVEVIQNVIESYKNDTDTTVSTEEVSNYIHSVRFLEDVLKFSRTCFFIVEYTNISYLYCSPNVSDILGHPAEAYLQGGPQFTLAKASKEDLAIHKIVHERIIELFAAAPEQDRALMKFAFTLRLSHEDGTQRQILQNNFILKWSADGKPIVKLFTLTDISAYKHSDDFIFFTSKIDGSGQQQVLSHENFTRKESKQLSPREIDILELAAKGLPNNKIGMKLRLAENTVKNHKKNIMKKLGTRNIAQTLALASLYGITQFPDSNTTTNNKAA